MTGREPGHHHGGQRQVGTSEIEGLQRFRPGCDAQTRKSGVKSRLVPRSVPSTCTFHREVATWLRQLGTVPSCLTRGNAAALVRLSPIGHCSPAGRWCAGVNQGGTTYRSEHCFSVSAPAYPVINTGVVA